MLMIKVITEIFIQMNIEVKQRKNMNTIDFRRGCELVSNIQLKYRLCLHI